MLLGRRRTLNGLLEKFQKQLRSWALQMLCKSSQIMHIHAKQLGQLLRHCMNHIFWTPCVVHSLNLAFKSIVVEVEWMKKLCEEAREVQIFITNHQHAQAMYKEFAKTPTSKGWRN
jgi:hypothetical protein